MEYISPEPVEPPDLPPVAMPSTSNPPVQLPGSKRAADPMDVGQGASRGKILVIDREAVNPSIQTVYTHPSMSVMGIREYEKTDLGPYIVHVAKEESDPNAGTIFRPIKFGQFLFNNKIENICRDGVKKVGRNKMSVQFQTYEAANKFICSPLLSAQKYEAFIPTYNVTRMGVVRGVPVDWSMEEFANAIEIPNSSSYVIKARRLNRKVRNDNTVNWEPTQTVVLTFRGQQLPTKIYCFYSALNVEIYEFPTIQCLACCRFGHIRTQCRSNPRCYRCAQPHVGDQCTISEPSASCLYCSGSHFATNKSCPEQARQKSIKAAMAREGISYQQASSLYKSSRPFNEVARSTPPRPQPIPSASMPTLSHPSYSNSTQAQHTLSYRKTVTHNPPQKPTPGKTYDKVAHQAITSPVQSSLPNGTALQMLQLSQSSPSGNSQSDLLVQLLSIIISIISQNSVKLPNHVAHMITQLTNLLSHNGSAPYSPVEQQEPSSEGP